MSLLSYFKCIEGNWIRDNSGKLGLLLYTERGRDFHPIGSDKLDSLTSADWFRSFTCQTDTGSCTFSKEFRKSGDDSRGYWYASKKINGKLRRVYFGCKSFTVESLESTLAKFSTPKKETVTQEVTQNQQKQASSKIEFINDFSVGDRVTYANPDHQFQKVRGIGEVVATNESHLFIIWQDNPKMKAPFNKLSSDKLILVAGHGKSDRHLQPSITDEILSANQEQIKALESENAILTSSLRQEKENYLALKMLCERQAQAIEHLQANLLRLEREASNYKNHVPDHLVLYEENTNKLLGYQATIGKYRQLSLGKTKKDNPRFAYLIDFLAEIDKLS